MCAGHGVQIVTDLLERDALVAEVYYGEEQWADVWYSDEGRLLVRLLKPERGPWFEFNVDEVVRTLEFAASELGPPPSSDELVAESEV